MDKKIGSKNKLATTLSLILILTISTTLIALPSSNAHDPPWTVPTWTFLSASPNPVGVGQVIWVMFWTQPNIPTASGALGDRYVFTVEVTKPDGNKETIQSIKSDAGGMGYTLYTPNQIGEYVFIATFNEMTITGVPGMEDHDAVGDTYLYSSSIPVNVTVQQNPITEWQEPPLPTEYWSRPINQLNRGWHVLAANWLGKESAAHNLEYSLNPTGISINRLFSNSLAPESAHIMWTRPIYDGGIMDTRYGNGGYQSIHYEGLKMLPPIILNGRLIYANYDTAGSIGGWWVVDLYTGETLSFHDTPRTTAARGGASGKIGQPTFASIYNYGSPNQHGGFPIIWITSGVTLPDGYKSQSGTQTWEMLDGYTFKSIAKIANASSSGFPVYGKDGSILRYSLVTVDGVQYLRCWNTSHIETLGRIPEGGLGNYVPEQTSIHNGNTGWSLNVSISPKVSGPILEVREDKYVIGGTGGKNNETHTILGNLWALSLEKGNEGTLLWNITFTPPKTVVPDVVPLGQKHLREVGLSFVSPEYDVFTFFEGVTLRRWCYSLKTGELLWGPTEPEAQWNHFDSMPAVIYQGKLISWGYSGIVTAYDILTGEVLWKYTAPSIGYEVPYGNCPLNLQFVADGKLFFASSEHSPDSPLTRSYYLRCVNASNGVELWKISLFGNAVEASGTGSIETAAIADGLIVAYNAYDNQIYCFGKGPTKTTVSVQNDVIELGNSVMIKGTVIDISPGAKQHEQAMRFPNGLPVVNDENMDEWMEYVYMQQSLPTNATGITVDLKAYGSDGTKIDIGTTTTDLKGNFGKAWQPPEPGEYTIIATFAGSNSYWKSSDTTYIAVAEESPQPTKSIAPTKEPLPTPATTDTPTPVTPSAVPTTDADMPTETLLIIGAAVVIIAVVAATALLLRKR